MATDSTPADQMPQKSTPAQAVASMPTGAKPVEYDPAVLSAHSALSAVRQDKLEASILGPNGPMNEADGKKAMGQTLKDFDDKLFSVLAKRFNIPKDKMDGFKAGLNWQKVDSAPGKLEEAMKASNENVAKVSGFFANAKQGEVSELMEAIQTAYQPPAKEKPGIATRFEQTFSGVDINDVDALSAAPSQVKKLVSSAVTPKVTR